MEIKINTNIKSIDHLNLPLLAIETAEELQRFSLNKTSNLESTKKLSELIQNEFSEKLNYSSIFSDAYFTTYDKKVPPMLRGSPKQYHKEISQKLSQPPNLKENELNQLINFCVNLSDYSIDYENYLRDLKSGPCFR